MFLENGAVLWIIFCCDGNAIKKYKVNYNKDQILELKRNKK